MEGIVTIIGDLDTWLEIVEIGELLEEKGGWNMRKIRITKKRRIEGSSEQNMFLFYLGLGFKVMLWSQLLQTFT